ncbi:Leucyl/phenylalanyl-tRNA--protein transferase [Candidatus Terasakiella magnetica]|uniref:Leucyl/phenylalanyl-tRNA--protein transferase n=1 Tax=Candidatus Terasakiella magnetica TaxID=1867952 RepID=A0A1C3RD58_9PROT|nr:leucyl/phenylalanyl-tRNA--protein transferase [Candidatus Terasakiella magnetica]SCA55195.1 Leucyl/phenylalanyl-tRNA--protein transferase [Candidatus Terasakiella magnetica]
MDRSERYVITAETLLRAYSAGVFPMAETRESKDLFWVDPEMRGIFPLDGMKISKSLYKTLRQQKFEVRCDTDFLGVMEKCAESTEMRPDTWMNEDVFRLYNELFHMGCAHSVECWQNDELVGGLYGVSLGAGFFGESMFSRKTNASKVALMHLVARLRLSGYILLDTQFITDHLQSLGAIEVPRRAYHLMLDEALQIPILSFYCEPTEEELFSELESMFLQSRTQTS